MKDLLTGNEAIARGAFENGVTVGVGYPGTPSTEILENFVRYPGIYAQWSPNEKVALEVGAGSAIGGARTLVTMKHVGVNVAADPLFTLAYTGVNAGLVLISADDPGMHSSQNEQDNRNYARFAKIPVLEPSNSQECKDMMGLALNISEQFDTPVMLRTTTRVAHSQSFVELCEKRETEVRPYEKNPRKYVMVPAHARGRHVVVEERRRKLLAYAETCPANKIERNDKRIGIITSGIVYEYVKEVLPSVSVLKLGLTFPLPENLIRDFASQVEELYVIEELEPFLEDQIKLLGIKLKGKELFPRIGEITQKMIAEKLLTVTAHQDLVDRSVLAAGVEAADGPVPVRPPVMCPGCPHRGVFYTLSQLKMTVMGDIGCYTLGAMPPLEAMDVCICMGASVGSALGFEKAQPEMHGQVVSVIGDSTFFHSGITGLLDIAYNKGATTTIILDNSTTAMTGHQDHPATGYTLGREITNQVDIEALVKALGIKRVFVMDAFDLEGLKKRIKEEAAAEEASVIIVKKPCALLTKERNNPYQVDQDVCIKCKKCMKLGCPALVSGTSGINVNAALCTGCGLCAQVCPTGALKKEGELNG